MESPENSHRRPILQLRNISLSQDGQAILNHINFDLYPGEIHALVGEHRAGKTPLIKLIAGELKKTDGTILIRGRRVDNMTPTLALRNKIGVISQEQQSIDNLTALENVIAGTIPRAWISHKYRVKSIHRCREILKELETDINLAIPVSELSTAERQMVELARLVYLDSDILILDDIGGRFTRREMRTVLRFLTKARDQGKSVIFIDSDIDNVLSIADRVTVLHHGFSGGTENVKDLDRLKLLKLTYNFALNIDEDMRDDSHLVLLQQYNENVIADLPAGVMVFDIRNRLGTLNRTAGRILGMDLKTPLGRPAEDIIGEMDLHEAEDIIDAVYKREIRSWDRVNLGADQSIKIKTIPYGDKNQIFQGTMVLVEDVTMDMTIKEYLVRAEKISSVAELAAGVSHEINNPLGIISNYLQVLKYKNLDGDVREKLEKMELQLDRIKETTGSLLSFSGFKDIPDREFDLIALLNEVVVLLNHKIAGKSVKVTKKLPEKRMIKGSENRLRQVFVNLVSNAIEAVPERGRIDISLQLNTPYVEVRIQDNGYGIPPEIQEEIFNPFFSTKMTRENAGLGLSICQHIVEAHKGLLTFESQPGDYTFFTVCLPA